MSSQADLIFAKIVVINNLATEEQVKDCLASLEKLEIMGQTSSLESLLLQKGYLNQRQITKVKSAQSLHLKLQEDQEYGKLCIQKNFCAQSQIQECLAIQKQRHFKERLFQILISKKYLTASQHNQITPLIASQATSSPAPRKATSKVTRKTKSLPSPTPSAQTSLFSKAVLEYDFASLEQVDECLNILQRLKSMGIKKTLGDLMLEKNYLSPTQVNRIASFLKGGSKTMQKEPSSPTDGSAKKSPIEGYIIEKKIGQGAMGIIYKGCHEKLGRIVAIKVLLPEFANDKEFVQRFLREAKAAITLHHPNIIQGYHVGDSNGFYYFAMEFVDGMSIKEKIEKEGVISEEEAIQIIIQMCKALEHAQENGIVHRDIKPDNIMITEDGKTKLGDLGIAKEINQDGSLTQTGIALGTPYYISPEQAMGEKKIDTRSDIYSLGGTFYHMITGQVPYEGDTSAVIMTKHISEEPPDPRTVNSAISPKIAQVIMKMMAKDKAYRYQNPIEILQELSVEEKPPVSVFGTGSSVFIQDGLKIPKRSPTRVSQIRKKPRGGRKKSSLRLSGASENFQEKEPNPLPLLIMISVGMVVAIICLVAFFFWRSM